MLGSLKNAANPSPVSSPPFSTYQFIKEQFLMTGGEPMWLLSLRRERNIILLTIDLFH
jgi:hypothetical protein